MKSCRRKAPVLRKGAESNEALFPDLVLLCCMISNACWRADTSPAAYLDFEFLKDLMEIN